MNRKMEGETYRGLPGAFLSSSLALSTSYFPYLFYSLSPSLLPPSFFALPIFSPYLSTICLTLSFNSSSTTYYSLLRLRRWNRSPSPKPSDVPVDVHVSVRLSAVLVGKDGRKEVWQVVDKGKDPPRELPVELWSKSLQSLNLQRNKLKCLPCYVGKLGALTSLDIS